MTTTTYQFAEASGSTTLILWIALLVIWTALSRWRHPQDRATPDDIDRVTVIGRRRSRRVTWSFVALGVAWPLLGMLVTFLAFS